MIDVSANFSTGINWLDDLFASIDRMDAAGFASYLTEDAQFRFGNADSVIGPSAIEQAVDCFFQEIGGLKHQVSDVRSAGDCIFCRGEVTYERLNGSSVTLPFADFFEMRGAKIHCYQIYMDISPLFA